MASHALQILSLVLDLVATQVVLAAGCITEVRVGEENPDPTTTTTSSSGLAPGTGGDGGAGAGSSPGERFAARPPHQVLPRPRRRPRDDENLAPDPKFA